jgi:sugar O-acyltransferase (sialic acid O-acetyltransferase NeuD family)
MNKKLILVGAGGHAKSVLDCVDREEYSEIVIIDTKENIGKPVLDLTVSGSDEDLSVYKEKGFDYAFVTVGSIMNTDLRRKLTDKLEKIGFILPNIIASGAVISRHADLAGGIFIGKLAVVNAGAQIDRGVILNTGSIVEHDCKVGEFSHVSVGAVLCGEVTLGSDVHIGANSVIKQQISVGSHTVVGMGSVVTHDLSSNILAFGNPCKEVRAL